MIKASELKVSRPEKRKCGDFPDEILEKILQNMQNVKSILVVGCGKGKLVAHLRKMGYLTEGIDISLVALMSNQELFFNGIIKRQDIEKAEINHYDLIFCNLSLRFIKDRQEVLSKLLRNSNILILSQVLLIAGVFYEESALQIGIWENDFLTLLNDTGASWEQLYSELDENCVLRQIFLLQ